MKQPRFVFWPWKALALLVPGMAFAAAIFSTEHSQDSKEVLTVFFGVLAAGNAYLFAIAVGDLGRSVLAIPTGALAGFLAVRVFADLSVNVVFLMLVAACSTLNLLGDVFLGCGLTAFAFIGLALAGSAYRMGAEGAWLCVWCAYPVTCACVTATMPLENTLVGFWNAGVAGLRAALYGMAIGLVAFVGTGLLWALMVWPVGLPLVWVAVVPAIFGALTANYFCVKHVFAGIHRVEVQPEQPAQEPPEENDEA